MSLDPKLLDILACPVCKSPLACDEKQSRLTCAKCSRHYPVIEGIPDLIP